ncbi:MAG: DUF4838 domain-containing protein [Clostridia bacterium]|nr:DUF4838 domain-containing protein [Clostridia bacterium]
MRQLIVKGTLIESIQILSGESGPEQYAAQEMAAYLSRIGIKMGSGMQMHIALDDTLPRDGYSITACPDCGISIRGGNGRGVIYGVYGFLEHYAGMRFFMPGLESPGEGDIVVDEDYAFTPVFEFRQSDWQCGNSNVDWCVKNGINQRAIPPEMGGHMKYGAFVHTMTTLVGTPPREQPCLSDPEVLKKAIAGVRKILAEQPDTMIISVSQNDNQNFCTCEKCAAVDAEEGSHAGTLLRFVNAVAADIARDYPHVIIDTLAYQYTRRVPAITKPLPNVCIRLCSIECCFSHPLADRTCPVNSKFHDDIIAWSKICDRIYIWDYVTNFHHYVPTFPNFSVLRENMRFFADHGVKGMYPEGQFNTKQSGEFGELRCYLLAKLMMNPYMSAAEYYRHMDEFLAAYYGEGWRYIRAYIDFACAEAAGGHMKIYDRPFGFLPRDKYEAMEETIEQWWDKAEAMAGDRLDYVKRSRLQWRYIRLMLHPDAEEGKRLRDDVEAAGVRWREGRELLPPDADLAKPPYLWL